MGGGSVYGFALVRGPTAPSVKQLFTPVVRTTFRIAGVRSTQWLKGHAGFVAPLPWPAGLNQYMRSVKRFSRVALCCFQKTELNGSERRKLPGAEGRSLGAIDKSVRCALSKVRVRPSS